MKFRDRRYFASRQRAGRVLVLTQRPGQLRLDLNVTLPRPRHMDMEYLPEFSALAARVRQTIG